MGRLRAARPRRRGDRPRSARSAAAAATRPPRPCRKGGGAGRRVGVVWSRRGGGGAAEDAVRDERAGVGTGEAEGPGIRRKLRVDSPMRGDLPPEIAPPAAGDCAACGTPPVSWAESALTAVAIVAAASFAHDGVSGLMRTRRVPYFFVSLRSRSESIRTVGTRSPQPARTVAIHVRVRLWCTARRPCQPSSGTPYRL